MGIGTEEGLETPSKVTVTGEGEEELALFRGTWILHPAYAKGPHGPQIMGQRLRCGTAQVWF